MGQTAQTRPLKIHFITDLEGAAMVFNFGQTRDNPRPHPARKEAMRILTQETNACVDGTLGSCAGPTCSW